MEENMTKLLLKYLSIISAIFILSIYKDTIYIDDITALFAMGLVLLIVNLLLKPVLLLISLPFSILTLGLFSFIVNAWTIMLADYFVKGITIGGFFNSFICAFVISILNHLFRGMNKLSKHH